MKKREGLMLAAIFLFWFSLYTYPSFLTDYSENTLGASPAIAGLIVSAYGFTQMLLRIPLGIFSDAKRNRKSFVMAGFGFSMLASAGLALVSRLTPGGALLPYLALIFRGVSGMAAATWVAFTVMYSSGYDRERTGVAMSRIMLPQYLSQVVAMLLGGYINSAFGATLAFLLATVGGLIGLIVIACVRDIPPNDIKPFRARELLTIARDKNLIMGTALSTIFHLICWATALSFVQTWATNYVPGFTEKNLGWLSVMYLLPNALIARANGTLIEPKLGRRAVMTLGFVIVGAACVMFTRATNIALLFITQGVFGVGMGLIIPITMTAAIETISEENRGAAMGVYQAIYGLGMFAGPYAAGLIIDGMQNAGRAMDGYRVNFMMCAALSIAGALLAQFMCGRKSR